MICIKCSHQDTIVVNSRPHKKAASTWRRRKCPQCKASFTTYEKPSLTEAMTIHLPDGQTDLFNIGRLIQSIGDTFSHNIQSARYDSLPLAQTVEDTLIRQQTAQLTPDLIATTTHSVLKRFDEVAAVQYAAKHRLIRSVRRRGRPSLSSPGL